MMLALPNEVVAHIFAYLSNLDLLHLAQTSHQQRSLVQHPSTWRGRCRRWEAWSDINLLRICNGHKSDDCGVNWYEIYMRRWKLDWTVQTLLEQYGRNVRKGYAMYDAIFDTLTDFGVDALDALTAAQKGRPPLEHLGYKFMASQAEGFIRRREGVKLLIRAARNELKESSDDDFDLLYSSLSYFCGSGAWDMISFMDKSAEFIRKKINLTEYTDISVTAEAICTFMTEEYLIADSGEVSDFLFDKSRRHFWSARGIFSGIAHRLGFKCGPIPFAFIPAVIMYREQSPDNRICISLVNSGTVYSISDGYNILLRDVGSPGVQESSMRICSFATTLLHMRYLVQFNSAQGPVKSWDTYLVHALELIFQPNSIDLESGEQWLVQRMMIFRLMGSRREMDIYGSDWFLEGISYKLGSQVLGRLKLWFRMACKSVCSSIEGEEMGIDGPGDAYKRKFKIGEIVKYNRYDCHGVVVSYNPYRQSIIETLNIAHSEGPFYIVVLSTGTRVCVSQPSLERVMVLELYTRQHINTLFSYNDAAVELGRYFSRFDYTTGLFVDHYPSYE